MRTSFYFLLIVVLTYSCSTNEKPQDIKTVIGEWQTIFNGTDLSGWETMGQLETKIEDGTLHILATHPNNNAWVLTQKSYNNFNLECEFLMEDTTANSGVLIRFDKSKTGIPNQTAFEANIDWRTDIQNNMGTLENAIRANLLEKRNPGSWNKMRIQAKGDHLIVWLNDQKLCETHNRRSMEGKIALQVPIFEGDEISFRNIKVQELGPETLEEPLEIQYRNRSKEMASMITNDALEGWHTIGEGKWTFEEEVLHGYSGAAPSFLVTDKLYKNFYLRCNFKIIKEDNSGIFIRKHPDSTNVNLEDAIECNIYDHNGMAHAYSTGSIVFHSRAWSNMIDYENWNEMEIFAKEEHIILFINGKKSAEAYLPASYNKFGNICLQAGTKVFLDNSPSDIYYKDLQIKAMD